jgi:hypothetical protein
MVFQSATNTLLSKIRSPQTDLEALHEVVRRAYEDAQHYGDPDMVRGLAKRLKALERQELLPETRLLLALLPATAREVHASNGMRTIVAFRELLKTIRLGEPRHYRNLTLFPLLWPAVSEPPYILLSKAIAAGEAVVEEVNEAGSVPNLSVSNHAARPLLIPEGEILVGAKQNRVVKGAPAAVRLRPSLDLQVVEMEGRVGCGRAAEAEPVQLTEGITGDSQILEDLRGLPGHGDREGEDPRCVPAHAGFDLDVHPLPARNLGQCLAAGRYAPAADKADAGPDVPRIVRRVAPLGEELRVGL